MSSPAPGCSVVVIAYNEEQRIGSCLEALAAQVHAKDFEVIVVDDGSSDATAEIVGAFCLADARFKLLRHERNRGRGAARLTGQEAAVAPLIGFVDADIEVPATWLASVVGALDSCDGVSGIAVPDGDCAVLARITGATCRVRPGPTPTAGGNVAYRRAALERYPFSPEAKLGEDFRLAHQMQAGGLALRCLPDLVVHHREEKTYLQGLRWMWQLGSDAATHPLELRRFRVPDAAFILAVAGLAAGIATAALGLVPWLLVPAWVATYLVATSLAFTYTRFSPLPHPLRWLACWIAATPMMAGYLGGRLAGSCSPSRWAQAWRRRVSTS